MAVKTGKKIRIIGAVAAGTAAAAKASRNDPQADIVLYDQGTFISYSGCGLPYYIGGSVSSLADLTPRDPAFFQKQYGVAVRILHRVLSVDPEHKQLTVRDLKTQTTFTDNYDTLVLSTGAEPVRPRIPGADQPHVFVLRTPDHARDIRAFIEQQSPRTAAVIGAGFIGMEMVENLTLAGLSVTLIEKLPLVPTTVDADVSEHIGPYLKEKGVTVFSGRSAQQIHEQAVTLDDWTLVDADLVLMAVGIRPKTDLAVAMGVQLGPTGAIAVDHLLRTNLPDVYACGDCAESLLIVDGSPIYRPLGSTASKQGRLTGEAITTGTQGHRGIAGTGIYKLFDLTVAATGFNEAQAKAAGFDPVVCLHTKRDRPAYMGGQDMVLKVLADRKSGKLLGAQIVGHEGVDKRMDVLVTAMTAGLTVSDLFHLDLAYSPPFSTTRDPVHFTGMILENMMRG